GLLQRRAAAPSTPPYPFTPEGLPCYPDPLYPGWNAPTGGRAEGWSVFAIIQSGGRQGKVVPGSVVTVDRAEAEVEAQVASEQVIVLEKDGGEVLTGAPFVANVKVVGVIDGESRGPKIRVFKKRRRKGIRRTRGHRSTYTRVRITDIVV